MTAAEIAQALQGRRSGRAWWVRCPAHEDRKPSLELTDAGGKVLVHCWSGCSQKDVIAALRDRGLWPERAQLSPQERREWAARRRAVEQAATRLRHWRDGLMLWLEDRKREASEANDLDALAWATRRLYLLQTACLTDLTAMYRATDPKVRLSDERAGARWEAVCREVTWLVVKGADADRRVG